MTEGNGHVIDPGGDAHRALQAAVAEHGPDVLSDAATMEGICRERLSSQPSEATLIGIAARSDVPALLQQQISRLGNYGGIQSVATSLADAHGLDLADSMWVVREYARALGLIASGGTRPTRRMSGSAGAGDAGAAGADALGAGAALTGAAGAAAAGAVAAGGVADTVLNRAAERPDEPGDTVLNRAAERPDEPGDTVLNSAAERPDEPGDTVLSEIPPARERCRRAGPGDTVLSEAAGSQPTAGDTVLSDAAPSEAAAGETVLDEAVRNEASRSADRPGDTILDADEQPGPGDTVISPVSSGQAPPVEVPSVEAPHSATAPSAAAGGVAATAAAATQAPESEATPDLGRDPDLDTASPARGANAPSRDDGPGWAGDYGWSNWAAGGGEPAASERPAGYQGGEPRGGWEPAAGNAAFGGYQQDPPPVGPAGGGPGYPPGPPGGDGYPAPQPLPYAAPKSNRNRNRNILGIAAAIALVAVYLGIAAAAHLTRSRPRRRRRHRHHRRARRAARARASRLARRRRRLRRHRPRSCWPRSRRTSRARIIARISAPPTGRQRDFSAPVSKGQRPE